ncbi:MAG: L,D-transpeptidase family protein [Pseudomonadota bacterium]
MHRSLRRSLLIAAICAALVGAFSAAAPSGDAAAPLAAEGERADRILVEKSKRRMTLWREGRLLRAYDIGLGFSPVGDKSMEGDGRTPEGVYRIDRRNAASAYHLSLGLNYPRPDQRRKAARKGRDPGGDIFIHGQPNALPSGLTIPGDWTAGCIAVDNAEMEEIWALVPVGTVVEVRP